MVSKWTDLSSTLLHITIWPLYFLKQYILIFGANFVLYALEQILQYIASVMQVIILKLGIAMQSV